MFPPLHTLPAAVSMRLNFTPISCTSIRHKQSIATAAIGVGVSLLRVKHGELQPTTLRPTELVTPRNSKQIQQLFHTINHHGLLIRPIHYSHALPFCFLPAAAPHKAEESQRRGAGSVHAAIKNSDDRRAYLATIDLNIAPCESTRLMKLANSSGCCAHLQGDSRRRSHEPHPC
jgi:hypothetical protein